MSKAVKKEIRVTAERDLSRKIMKISRSLAVGFQQATNSVVSSVPTSSALGESGEGQEHDLNLADSGG